MVDHLLLGAIGGPGDEFGRGFAVHRRLVHGQRLDHFARAEGAVGLNLFALHLHLGVDLLQKRLGDVDAPEFFFLGERVEFGEDGDPALVGLYSNRLNSGTSAAGLGRLRLLGLRYRALKVKDIVLPTCIATGICGGVAVVVCG